MQRLRPLILAMLVAGVGARTGQGATQSLGFTIQTDSRKGPLDVSDLNRRFALSQTTERLNYSADGIFGGLSVQAALAVVQPDYSSVLIRDKRGTEIPLSQVVNRRAETSLETGFGLSKGPHSANLGWKGNVSDSPFASQLLRAGYTRSFFSQSTAIGVNVAYLDQSQPESYFIDRDFRTKSRPLRIHAYDVATAVDQVLSSSWKMRNQVGISRRIEERPLNVSLSSRHAYAITERLFSELTVSYASELRSQALQNERGYFRAYGIRGALTVEPYYDLLVTASYGVSWEREQDTRVNRQVQVAADQYGLGLTYSPSAWEAQILGTYTATNTGIRNIAFTGSFTWKI